jgi:hypothetical protein
MMMGDGEVLGDGQLGPQAEPGGNPAIAQQNLEAEAAIRQDLLSKAYGTEVSPRRAVDKS